MCSVCGGTYSHLRGCPEGPAPKVIGKCAYCGEDITEEEETYFELESGELYHDDCFHDVAAGILLDKYGASLRHID